MAKKLKTTPTQAAQTGGSQTQQSQQSQQAKETQQPGQSDAISLLKADHRKVEQLFSQYESAGSRDQKRQLARQICNELIVHTKLEEEIFYPACREKVSEHEALDEAQVEHDSAKILIGELMSQDPDSEYYDAKVTVLSEYVKHHVGEEEKASDGIFAQARTAQVDMNALGQRLQARKQELMSQAESQGFRPPQPRALELSLFEAGHSQEYQAMDRRYDRDRDEQGRFTSDDDRDNGRSRSGGRERDEYGRFMSDDDRDNGRSRSGGRERDEYGRFMSDDDEGYRSRGGGGRGRSRYEDDDDGRSSRFGGRGQGGWFGDPEGHSEASRRGWEERGSSRGSYRGSSRYEDDDDGRSSRGGRGQGGWFGDPEGHSEASRRGWEERGYSRSSRYDDDDDRRYRSRGRDDDDDGRSSRGGGRGQGGWFGDSEGHAEAARRGWEERGGSSSRGSSRGSSRSDDDDDRSSRGSGRGQGGWFGDSRGHAEAARRGWQNR
jgi:hemerythrin superfamily protein